MTDLRPKRNTTLTLRQKCLMSGLALLIASCGGEGDAQQPVTLPPTSPIPTPVPTPTPTPAPTPALPNFQTVIDAAEAYNDADFAIIIGDETGILFEYEKGDFAVTERYLIASASKWLTAASIMRLVDNGVMQLSDNPQDYMPYWTSDPADRRSTITLEQLLSFTSGFNASPLVNSCVTDGNTTIQSCAEEIYGFDIATDPGTAYSYGPHHMQIAAAMAERATGQSFNAIFRNNIADRAGMSTASSYVSPSTTNPKVSGGGASTARDYAAFLHGLLNGSLIDDRQQFLADRTSNVSFLFRPDATAETGDWHYALGAWLECDEATFVQSCADAQIYSSPGSFGWTPWIDLQNGYFALIARRGALGTADIGVELEQLLQPLIVEAINDR